MSAPPAGPPLINLLGRAKHAFTTDFDARLANSEFCALSLAHSANVMRHLGDGPLRQAEIVDRCGVTKQAVSQQIVHLERNGYVEVSPDPKDQRARLISLTDKGVRAQEFVLATFDEIERDWAGLIGTRDAAGLRRALTALLDRVGQQGC